MKRLALAVWLCWTAPAAAGWRTLKTEHFTVFYADGHEPEAWAALDALEWTRPQVEKLTDSHRERVPIVIDEAGTISNGGTDPVNMNIHLYTSAPGAGLLPEENWWAGLTIHEYTHMLHLTYRGGIPGGIAWFGGSLLNPSWWVPPWMAEGLAVYEESSYSPYSGRLNDGFFDAYLAAGLRNGEFPDLMQATFAPVAYPLDYYYLAGAEFTGWLARTYGPEKLAAFYHRHDRSLLAYLSPLVPGWGIDLAAEKVYGKSIPDLWYAWSRSCSGRFQDWKMDGEKVTSHGWTIESLTVDGGTLFYVRSYVQKTGAFAADAFNEIWARDLRTGEERILVGTTTGIHAGLAVRGGVLYYAVTEIEGGHANVASLGYGFTSIVRAHDLASGRDRELFRRPIRGFGVLPDGRVVYSVDRTDGFGSDLFAYDLASQQHTRLASLAMQVDEFAADDHQVVVTARPDWRQFSLYRLDPATGTVTPLIDTPWVEAHPALVGDRVVFMANWKGSYGIKELDPASGTVYELTRGGYANWPAVDAAAGTLYYVGLTAAGNDLYRKPRTPAAVAVPDNRPITPPVAPVDRTRVARGGFGDDLRTLAPTALHMPFASLDGRIAGIAFGGADAIGHVFNYALIPAWDFRDHRPAVSASAVGTPAPPLEAAASVSTLGTPSWDGAVAYPLVLRLSPGLSELAVGAHAGAFDDRNRREGDPYVLTAFSWPGTALSVGASVPFERQGWGSAVDRTGVVGQGVLDQYIYMSRVLVQGAGFADRDNPDSDFARIRGYQDGLAAGRGAEAAVDFTAPLIPLREGIWWFSGYLEDLSLGAFFDLAAGDAARTQYAYGAEALAEVKISNFEFGSLLEGAVGVRYVRTREHQERQELVLEVFSLGGGVGGLAGLGRPERSEGLARTPDPRYTFGTPYRLRQDRTRPTAPGVP